jgi:hypothetical protein
MSDDKEEKIISSNNHHHVVITLSYGVEDGITGGIIERGGIITITPDLESNSMIDYAKLHIGYEGAINYQEILIENIEQIQNETQNYNKRCYFIISISICFVIIGGITIVFFI